MDEPGFVEFAAGIVEQYAPDDLVFPGTYAQLRTMFIAVCRELGVPSGCADGLSLGSLRPGGATWMYRVSNNSEMVRFRGRWASTRMLEIYIQEVGATSVLTALPPSVRSRIALLAAAAPPQLARAAAGWQP